MAADDVRFSCRIVGTRGEATAGNFVQPHRDDRVAVVTPAGRRVEELGRRPSYTYQLEALASSLREGTPFAVDVEDAVDTMRLIDECYTAAGFAPRPRVVSPAPRLS